MTIQLDGTVVSTTMRTPGQRLRAGRRVLLHRGPARRGARDRRALLRRRLGRWPASSTSSPSRPAGGRRRRRRASAPRRRAAAGAAATRSTRCSTAWRRCRRSTPIDPDVLAAVPDRVLGGPGPVRDDRRRPRRGGVRPRRRGSCSPARTSAATTPSTRSSARCCSTGGLPATGRGLFVSGRASVEMVQKAWAGRLRHARRGQRADRARRPRGPAGRPDARRLRPRRRLQRLRPP